MTSDLKIAANRKNSKKSTGPRTHEGKTRASRNSLRHGLAAVNFPDDGHTEKVERVARAICKDDVDPLKYVEALIIAESEVLLARVRAARVAALKGLEKERQNERSSRSDGEIENRTVVPRLHRPPSYPTIEDVVAMVYALRDGHIRKVTKVLNRIAAAIRFQNQWLKAKQAGKPIDQGMWACKAAFRNGAIREALNQFPSHESLRRVLPELISLERYERRALSRRRRAIRRFDALRSAEHSSAVV